MIFETFIDKDLGHVSFIFGDDESKEVVVVDPRRDIDIYEKYINENGLNIKYVLNTHTHADYIGGHLEIVNRYKNAKNIFHKNVPSPFDFIKVEDGDSFSLGDSLSFKIIETPGHTPFCISAIVNEDGEDKYIFIGDILFVGDIARPDLLGVENIDILTKLSYKSAKRLYNMDDRLMIFTSHISGSFCGKNLKSQYFSTLGIEKKTNYSFSLSQKSEYEYINNLKTQDIETPKFFKEMAGTNINGPRLIKDLGKIKQIEKNDILLTSSDDYIIDIRHPNYFKNGFIENSINIYEKSNVSLIAGSLLDSSKNIYLVGDVNSDFKEVIKKLHRVGLDNIIGILNCDVDSLDGLIKFNNIHKKIKVINLDRTKQIPDAMNIEISDILSIIFNDNECYSVNCKNGFKGMSVSSYLFKNNINVLVD